MISKMTEEIAESFGLTLEASTVPQQESVLRVYKGARQIFIGTDEAVREFLAGYKYTRPSLYESSFCGYRE